MSLPQRLKAAVARLIDYQINRLVALDPPAAPPSLPEGYRFAVADETVRAALAAHPERMVSKAAGFMSSNARAFALLNDDGPAAVAVFHPHPHFGAREVWRLRAGEAGLVELVTVPAHRGRGLATALIAHASAAMFADGARRLVSWMWWSNSASRRAFLKAGYHDAGWQIGVRPPWRRRHVALRRVRRA